MRGFFAYATSCVAVVFLFASSSSARESIMVCGEIAGLHMLEPTAGCSVSFRSWPQCESLLVRIESDWEDGADPLEERWDSASGILAVNSATPLSQKLADMQNYVRICQRP